MGFDALINKDSDGDRLRIADGGSIRFDKSSSPVTITNTSGLLVFTNVPTSDPSSAGALWANSGVLTLSSG